jgi:O-methyltransferase domain/Dimerisation domain
MSASEPEARVWSLMRGALGTKALAAVADLGVADALADGPKSVARLAEESRADPATLHRLLRALASEGVFAEDEPGVFRNTASSELLRQDGRGAWREFAHLFGGVFFTAVGGMDARTSTASAERTLGKDYWSWLAARPDERAVFDRAMSGGKERSAERLSALEWHGDETVVDVGGGNGALLRDLIARRQGLHGVVFDLPETVRDADLGDNLSFVAGSFFDAVPAGDAYILSGVLHDWDDEHAASILRTIRSAALPDARLLIVEDVVPPGNDPHGAKWLDLLMLVLVGGRERGEADWRALLGDAGFAVEHVDDGLIRARCR